MTNSTLCPACIKLPEWQWVMFTEADDFCREHVWRRYPEIPVTDEEVQEAREARNADPYGWGMPLDIYLPRRQRRCRTCGYEWMGTPHDDFHVCRIGMEGEMVYGPYLPNQPDEWDDDRYAPPTHMGTHRQSR
jgi:hypothetical protein